MIAKTPDIEHLVFHHIKEDFIIKQIYNINIKKQQEEVASARIKNKYAKPICELVNKFHCLKCLEKLKEAIG